MSESNSEPVVCAKVKKSESSEVWFSTVEWGGKSLVDVREYYFHKEGKVYRPTKKGVRFPIELIAQVIDLCDAVRDSSVCEAYSVVDSHQDNELRIALRSLGENNFLDVRRYFRDGDKVDMSPGKGVTVPVSRIGEFVNALQKVEEVI